MNYKRQSSVIIVIVLVLSLLAGCGTAPLPSSQQAGSVAEGESPAAGISGEEEKTVITYWNGFTGPDGPVLQELIKEYNETNTANVEVVVDIMPWDVLFQRLATVLPVQEGPDIIAFATENIGTYVRPGALAAVDDIFASGQIDSALIPPALNENLKFNGSYYGVPMNMATLLLYYNKDIFALAGLDPESPPTTWNALEEYALRITQIPDQDLYGFGLAVKETIPMWPIMLWGNGGDYIEDGRSVFNSDANVETITHWANLIKENQIAPAVLTGAEIDKLFESQRLGMYFCGPWATGGFANAGVNFGIAPVPAGPARSVTLGTGVAMVMTASSREQEAVYDFFSWWNTADVQVQWSLGSGFPLARTDAIDDPRLQQNQYVVDFSSVTGDAEFYLQQLTNFSQIDTQVIIPALESILLTNADVREALDQYSAELDNLLAQN